MENKLNVDLTDFKNGDTRETFFMGYKLTFSKNDDKVEIISEKLPDEEVENKKG